jgi:hypothetical protein
MFHFSAVSVQQCKTKHPVVLHLCLLAMPVSVPFLQFSVSLLEYIVCSFLGAFVNFEKGLLAASHLFLSFSFHVEQLGSISKNFCGIWYLSIFVKRVGKIQVSLKSDNNSGYCTWRPVYIFIVSRIIILKMRNVSDKRRQPEHILCSKTFSERRVVYGTSWEDMVQPDGPQMYYGACVSRDG